MLMYWLKRHKFHITMYLSVGNTESILIFVKVGRILVYVYLCV